MVKSIVLDVAACFFLGWSGTDAGGHRILSTIVACRHVYSFQFIVFLLLQITVLQVTMPDPKPAEVIYFLLIVKEISVLAVINWTRKPVHCEREMELEERQTGNRARAGGGVGCDNGSANGGNSSGNRNSSITALSLYNSEALFIFLTNTK